jgi:hypothetical protein
MVSIRSNRDWSKEEAQARSKGIDVNRLGGQGGVGPSACQAAAECRCQAAFRHRELERVAQSRSRRAISGLATSGTRVSLWYPSQPVFNCASQYSAGFAGCGLGV